ncbi:MAG: aminotransferase class V-fold PLP-dependent enzyme [Ignavibacteriaceae bacterium]|nr:aminotransferase class V-fold PLP-dependent enzyme [Ignavibacteriaceae bacterium]
MTIQEVRDLFPHINAGKIYFNNAATGAFSKKVLKIVDEYLLQRSETDIDNFEKFLKTMVETKVYLGKMLNCSAERIAFGDSTSNGMNILAQGLKWHKGNSILLNDLEFPANVYPFLNLEKEGVSVDFVKSKNGIVSAKDVISSIKPNTKLISISFVQFLTGYRVDLEKIGNVCRERGIIFSVDAIQGLGAFTIDVEKYKIDFIACGTAKWLLGMQGLAFIYISEKLQQILQPKYIGWLSVEDAWNLLDYNLKLKNTAEVFQGATINALGVFGLLPSLKLFADFGYKNVEERILENSIHFTNRLLELGIHPILEKCERENLSGIISFKHDKSNLILDELKKREIYCSVREGMVRLSPHFFNTLEEIDRVTEAIKNILHVS